MKILHISRTMGQGGAEKVVYQICKESKNNEMLIASTGGVLEEKLREKGIKHINIPDIDCKNPFIILKTFCILFNLIKKENIDIVHSHHRMAAFYSRVLNFFNKKFKRVYTAHNVFFNKKSLSKFSLKNSKIVAVGNGVKNNLINVYEIKEENITVIYNSIDKPKKMSIPKDEFIQNKENKIFVGTVGRLSEQKGMDIFISAIAKEIKNNNNIFGIIIGDGELKESLIKLTEEKNVKENIIFLGYRKDVLELIKVMDFIVLSSRWEGFPLTPIETFSVGKTIIASNIDGNNEIVKDEINGILFEKDNVKELSTKINYLINNEKVRNILENNALKTYNECFDYKVFIKLYQNLYENAMGINL